MTLVVETKPNGIGKSDKEDNVAKRWSPGIGRIKLEVGSVVKLREQDYEPQALSIRSS